MFSVNTITTELSRTGEARTAFVRGLELCRRPIIPSLAANFVRNGNWATLHKELSRGEKAGWLSLDDWKLWARSAKGLGDQPALTAILARFEDRAGPDCPLVKELAP